MRKVAGEHPFCVLIYMKSYLFHILKKTKRCNDNQQTIVTHFGENKRLHLESPKQKYYIISLWVIKKVIFIHCRFATCKQWRAASGGALAQELPRATGVGPEVPQIRASPLFPFFPPFFHFFLRSDVSSFWDRTSMKKETRKNTTALRGHLHGRIATGTRPVSNRSGFVLNHWATVVLISN